MSPDPAPTCTMIYLARRNPRLAPEQFPQAWREHSALGKTCRNVIDKVLGVAQCSRDLEHVPPGATTAYDGVNLLRVRDPQAAQDIWSDPETLAVMRPDEPRVFDGYVRDFTLVCSESVLRDRPRTATVLVGFLPRRAEVPAAAFRSAWPGGTAAPAWLAPPLPGAVGRVVHHTVELPPPAGYAYDGIAEWWFDSAAAAMAALSAGGDLRQALPGAYAELADLGRSVFMLCRVTHTRP